jgi:hypothetical protein
MKIYGGVDVFLPSALVGGEWPASLPVALTPRKRARYPSNRRLCGPESRFGQYGEIKILHPTGSPTPLFESQHDAARDCERKKKKRERERRYTESAKLVESKNRAQCSKV